MKDVFGCILRQSVISGETEEKKENKPINMLKCSMVNIYRLHRSCVDCSGPS